MTKTAKRSFWITMGICIIVAIPVRHFFKTEFPLVHELIVAVGSLLVLYWALRHIYEHWGE